MFGVPTLVGNSFCRGLPNQELQTSGRLCKFLRKKREPTRFRLQPRYLLGGALLGLLFGVSRGVLVDGALGLWQPLGGALIGAMIGTVLSGPEVSAALREMPVMMKRKGIER